MNLLLDCLSGLDPESPLMSTIRILCNSFLLYQVAFVSLFRLKGIRLILSYYENGL